MLRVWHGGRPANQEANLLSGAVDVGSWLSLGAVAVGTVDVQGQSREFGDLG
jgi:hypothetical protein